MHKIPSSINNRDYFNCDVYNVTTCVHDIVLNATHDYNSVSLDRRNGTLFISSDYHIVIRQTVNDYNTKFTLARDYIINIDYTRFNDKCFELYHCFRLTFMSLYSVIHEINVILSQLPTNNYDKQLISYISFMNINVKKFFDYHIAWIRDDCGAVRVHVGC